MQTETEWIDGWYGCLASQHFLGETGFGGLIRAFGSARAVYEASPEERRGAVALTPAVEASLAHGPDFNAWDRLLEDCARAGIRVTAPGRADFPAPLGALEAPPPLLYMQGAWLPRDARAVALVGTRGPTPYGRHTACELARRFSEAGMTVVSGLALGIDAAAHAGALSEGGRSLAVIGCGLDIPYPRENLGLRARLEEEGAVLSEHPPGTPPQQMNYPRRNRLISALAQAVVVVEAGERSGALITAAHALRQGRPLFAVPGPIFSPVSAGTHALLREGARMLSSAEDVLAALREAPGAEKAAAPAVKRRAARARKPREPADPVLRLWDDAPVRGFDALAARAAEEKLWPPERAPAELLDALLRLELRGRVERLPGPQYRKVSGIG